MPGFGGFAVYVHMRMDTFSSLFISHESIKWSMDFNGGVILDYIFSHCPILLG